MSNFDFIRRSIHYQYRVNYGSTVEHNNNKTQRILFKITTPKYNIHENKLYTTRKLEKLNNYINK